MSDALMKLLHICIDIDPRRMSEVHEARVNAIHDAVMAVRDDPRAMDAYRQWLGHTHREILI